MIQCLLLITLLNQGNYFSETIAQIPLVCQTTPGAQNGQLHWQLTWNDRILKQDVQALNTTKATIPVQLPNVRQRTRLQWHYQLKTGDQILANGDCPLTVFPASPFAKPVDRFKDMRLTVITDEHALPAILKRGGLVVRHIRELNELGLQRPDFLIIDKPLPSTTFNRPSAKLQQMTRAGTQIVLFNEPVTTLPIQKFPHSQQAWYWQANHMLLAGLETEDWKINPSHDAQSWVCINQDRDAALLEIAGFTPESKLATMPLLVGVQTLDQGRIVYWQLPFGAWDNDPRAQQALLNCLDYLSTPVAPTPSRQWRQDHQIQSSTKPQPIPTIGNY